MANKIIKKPRALGIRVMRIRGATQKPELECPDRPRDALRRTKRTTRLRKTPQR